MQTRESRIQAILAKVHAAHATDSAAPLYGRIHVRDQIINNAKKNGIQNLKPTEAVAEQVEDIMNTGLLKASCCFISDSMLQALEREGIDKDNEEIYTEVYGFMIETEQGFLKALANTHLAGGIR